MPFDTAPHGLVGQQKVAVQVEGSDSGGTPNVSRRRLTEFGFQHQPKIIPRPAARQIDNISNTPIMPDF